MEAIQQSRSMRLRSIYSARTKLKLSWRVSLIMMIPGKVIIQRRRVIMEVPLVIQNIRVWRATTVTRRGTLELIVGFERINNQMLMSLNWLEKMKNSETFYLLQTDQLVTKIDGLSTLAVHNTSVSIERCSPHTLRFKREKSSWEILLQARWLAKEQFSLNLIMDVSLLFKAFVMFLNQGIISSLLEPYIKKGSVLVLKVILRKSPKRLVWNFRPNISAMCICCGTQKLQLVDCSYSRLRKRWL